MIILRNDFSVIFFQKISEDENKICGSGDKYDLTSRSQVWEITKSELGFIFEEELYTEILYTPEILSLYLELTKINDVYQKVMAELLT